MNKLFWIQQLIARLKTEKPAFFAKLQIYAGVLLALCTGVEVLAGLDVIAVSEKVTGIVALIMAFLLGSGLVAQLPQNDSNAKK